MKLNWDVEPVEKKAKAPVNIERSPLSQAQTNSGNASLLKSTEEIVKSILKGKDDLTVNSKRLEKTKTQRASLQNGENLRMKLQTEAKRKSFGAKPDSGLDYLSNPSKIPRKPLQLDSESENEQEKTPKTSPIPLKTPVSSFPPLQEFNGNSLF